MPHSRPTKQHMWVWYYQWSTILLTIGRLLLTLNGTIIVLHNCLFTSHQETHVAHWLLYWWPFSIYCWPCLALLCCKYDLRGLTGDSLGRRRNTCLPAQLLQLPTGSNLDSHTEDFQFSPSRAHWPIKVRNHHMSGSVTFMNSKRLTWYWPTANCPLTFSLSLMHGLQYWEKVVHPLASAIKGSVKNCDMSSLESKGTQSVEQQAHKGDTLCPADTGN